MGAEEAGRGRRQASDEGAKQQQGEQTSRGRYRWAKRLILGGSLMFLVSLLVLFMVPPILTGVERDPAGGLRGSPPPPAPTAPTEVLPTPTEALPGETAEEYSWRAYAEEQQAAARAQLEDVIAALDPAAPLDANGQTALQAELRLIAVLLDEAAQSRQLGIEARIESVAEAARAESVAEAARAESVTEAARAESVTEAAPQGAERQREGAESTSGGGTQTAATIALVVALLTATAGLVAALAGMFTALATWIKARRQPASTDTSASA